MPEIGEVARIVHYLKKSLVGKTLATVKVQDDANVYGKVGTTAAEFQKAMTGKKVLDARQQGKYFWLVMSSPPHPVMHFGMTGWMKIRNEETFYYKPAKEEEEVWPPKFWKFILETAEEPKCEAAFVDSRRFARIRLLDCDADVIRDTTPLKENGPDPVIDKDVITEEWVIDKMRSKKVPVKALMLDQANISGIGNWVGDEILYHARIHPEQYSNTLTDAQLKQLHTSILHICSTAVDLLADSSRFPEEWLFKHRWGKGKKDQKKELPNGEKIVHITVGGRTSAVVPSVQKKTGPVAGDIKSEDIEGNSGSGEEKEPKTAKRKTPNARPSTKKEVHDTEAQNTITYATKSRGKKDENQSDQEKDLVKPSAKKRKSVSQTGTNGLVKEEKAKKSKTSSKVKGAEDTGLASGRRRSTRASGRGS